jgi:hypothetical protein
MDKDDLNDEIIRYYKLKDQMNFKDMEIKRVDAEIKFLTYCKELIAKQMATGVSEEEAFQRVKWLVGLSLKYTDNPPKDPLQ